MGGDPAAMSVRELKQILDDAGVSHVGVAEKHELVSLARGALEAAAAAEANPAAGAALAVGESTVKMAGWETKVIRPPGATCALVVFHGFGATRADFEPFAQQFGAMLPHVMWVFPQAPVDPALGATAWWKINVMEWMMTLMTRDEAKLAQMIRKEMDGLPACRANGAVFIQELCARGGLSGPEKVHLGGFSQGAMTAVDIGLSLEVPPASLTMISGAPIVVEQWAEKLKKLNASHPGKKIKIFISHGQADQVLPFMASQWAVDLFKAHPNTDVTYVPHPGGHDVGGGEVLQTLAGFWIGSTS